MLNWEGDGNREIHPVADWSHVFFPHSLQIRWYPFCIFFSSHVNYPQVYQNWIGFRVPGCFGTCFFHRSQQLGGRRCLWWTLGRGPFRSLVGTGPRGAQGIALPPEVLPPNSVGAAWSLERKWWWRWCTQRCPTKCSGVVPFPFCATTWAYGP